MKRCINPPLEQEKMNQLFTSLVYTDKKDGIIYTELTGNFPLQSIDGYNFFSMLCDWTTNATLVTPVKDATDESMLAAFK